MKCARCGRQLSEEAEFCPGCGMSQVAGMSSTGRPWTVWVGVIVNIGVCVLAALGCITSLGNGEVGTESSSDLLVTLVVFGFMFLVIALIFLRQSWARVLYILEFSLLLLASFALIGEREMNADSALGMLVVSGVMVVSIVLFYLPVTNDWFRRR